MRAFLAITPDERTLDAIALVQRRCQEAVAAIAPGARVSWARRDALHLTVRFFAEIDDERAVALQARVAETMEEGGAVDLPLARVGGFPRLTAPRVLWIGPPEGWMNSRDGTRLTVIAQAIDQACDLLGLPEEDRRWSPHITLARVKDGERSVGNAVREVSPAAPTTALRADHVTLYKSEPSPAGVRHTRLWTVPVPTHPPHRPLGDRP